MLQQRLDFRRECERVAVPEIVERLDAQAVAGAEQLLAISVPYGEGKHAAEVRQALVAILLVGVNHRLRVAMALVAMSGGFEFRPYVGVIENFDVVGDPQRVVRSEERRVGKECRSRW